MSKTAFLLATLVIVRQMLSSPIEPRGWGHKIDIGILTSQTIPGCIGERPLLPTRHILLLQNPHAGPRTKR